MSDINKAPLCIPGGEKLLRNIEDTGETLTLSGTVLEEQAEHMTKEMLIAIIQGHAKIGEAMLKAVGRVRKKME